MYAVEISAVGGPEVLEYKQIAEPTAGDGQILVRTEAIGVNFIDTYYRRGLYPSSLPFVPGDEGAGTVVALGAGVEDFSIGDRVVWSSPHGSYAQLVSVPASEAVPLPDGISCQDAASVFSQGLTAHYLAYSTYAIQEGDTVVVHAGAGGVGLLLTQMAAQLGAKVITTVSTDAKEQISREAGAWQVLRYDQDIAARVRELTEGQGAAVVYDGVGAATFDASLASVRVRGLLALFGAASGPVSPMDPQRLNAAGSVYLTRPTIGDYIRTREELLWRAREVFAGVTSGTLKATIGGRYALSEAERAHRDLESRSTVGSLLLLP